MRLYHYVPPHEIVASRSHRLSEIELHPPKWNESIEKWPSSIRFMYRS